MFSKNYYMDIEENSTTEMMFLHLNDMELNTESTFNLSPRLISNFTNILPDHPKKPIFKVIKPTNYKGRKRARKIYISQESNLLNGKHTKYCKDNILRRIKVHSFHFIIELSNDYIKKVCRKKIVKFKKAECNEIVSDVTIKFNHILKNLPLSNILCQSYNQSDNVNLNEKKNSNKNLIKLLIKDYKEFESFFSLTYEELFKFFICDKEQKIELEKNFGLKRAITMEDYIENQIKSGIDNETYGYLFRQYAKDFFYYLEPEHARKSTKIKNYKYCYIK